MSKPVSKDDSKKDKTLPEKLKQLFVWKKPSTASRPSHWKCKEEVILNAEVVDALGMDNPLPVRLKAIKDLSEVVLTKFLEDCALETLVHKTEDLLNETQPAEARQTILKFYSYLIKGQFEKLSVQRSIFFELVRNHNILEDLESRFEMFKALTNNGKSVVYFEEEAGYFLLEWMPTAISVGTSIADFLGLLINYIKYNSAYVDPDVVAGLVKNTCILTGRTVNQPDIRLCLLVLDVVNCYSTLPPDILPDFIIALCRTVNIKPFSTLSWKVMKNLLGTSMGQSTIYTLCLMIQDRSLHSDQCFLRGAVFFLGVALWGEKRVTSLQPILIGVLPSLYKVLICDNLYVIQEVVFCVEKLITHHFEELSLLTWQTILDVVEKLLCHCEVHEEITSSVHSILTRIEQLNLDKLFSGSSERLYEIVGQHSHSCPISSVLRLLDFKVEFIYPNRSDWIVVLSELMESYFRTELRTEVRVKVLKVVGNVLVAYRHAYEEVLIDNIVLPFLSEIQQDEDVVARKMAVQLLVDIAQDCVTNRCLDILEIVEKVINNPIEHYQAVLAKDGSESCVPIINQDEIDDITTAITGLINIFKKKLFIDPAYHSAAVFKILTDHVQNSYSNGSEIEQLSTPRRMVLEFLLKLRANEIGQIALEENETLPLKFSATVVCSSRETISQEPVSSPLLSPTSPDDSSTTAELCIASAFQAIVCCLKEEKDWISLQQVLQQLAKLLQNKALVISSESSITTLCTTLCGLVISKSQNSLESLHNVPSRITRTDLHALIFPSLTNLAAYSCEFGSHLQRMLIKSLEVGLMSKSARSCITALTLCTLEMCDVMYKVLPEVLLSLSKISATITISVPVLEFLSNLVRLPALYASFVEDQYLIIFAIALPYTNPFKFHQYTVALAHHVIAMWYLRCRLPFRRDFVPFIVKGLRSNVATPIEGNSSTSSQTSGEEPKRPRSGSLNDPAVKRQMGDLQPRTSLTPAPSYSDVRPTNEALVMELHQHMLETCLDLLGRYCFGTHTSLTHRSSLAEFLFEKGKCRSMTWLVGHKLITVTTSGIGSKAYKDGLCEKCYKMCQSGEISALDERRSSQEKESTVQSQRKRHKSAIQLSTRETAFFGPRSKDDMHIYQASPAVVSLRRSSSTATSRPRSRLERQVESSECGDCLLKPQKNEKDTIKGRKTGDFMCNCWCLAWAEVLVRRPTGNTYFLMRLQNKLFINNSTSDFPVPDISNWFTTEEELLNMDCTDDIPSHTPVAENQEAYLEPVVTQCTIKSPLRRSNSSPDLRINFETPKTVSIPSENTSSTQFQFSTNDLPQSKQSSPQSEKDSPLPVHVMPSESTGVLSVEIQQNDLILSETSKPVPSNSPVKDDSCCPIPEEGDTKSSTKTKLKLDLSTVNPPQQSVSPPLLPLSAGPYSGGKGKSSPHSPFFRKGSTSPPPTKQPLRHRDRGHTISVVSPVQATQGLSQSSSFASRDIGMQHHRDMYYIGVHPSYVFLELFQNLMFGSMSEMPLLLPRTQVVERAVKVLDHIPHYEAHKIGVIYVGPGQANDEVAILSNRFGSIRYNYFLQKLGNFIRLKDLDQQTSYAGGLDLNGQDGKFALSWQEDIMQVLFHVATLMPYVESDPSCNNKKLHIGNDYVTIVYNNSQEDFNISTVKCQFIYVVIIVEPKECSTNVISVKCKPEIADVIGQFDPRLVSDDSLSMYVRQLALHANLASVVFQRQKKNIQDPYVSNWLERLRQLKRLRDKVIQELPKSEDEPSPYDPQRSFEDFTAFI